MMHPITLQQKYSCIWRRKRNGPLEANPLLLLEFSHLADIYLHQNYEQYRYVHGDPNVILSSIRNHKYVSNMANIIATGSADLEKRKLSVDNIFLCDIIISLRL